jgi:hypothetical protein
MLTDRYGPRLTGSPNYEAAARWTMKQMTDWGLKNAHLEPWDFGHPGWTNEHAAGYMVAPVRDTLVLEVLAWTPSTRGTAVGQAVLLVPPERPTKDELTAWFDANKDKARGRIVLLGKPATLSVVFTAPAKRMEDEAVRKRLEGRGGGPQRPEPPKPDPTKLTGAQATQMIDAWLLEQGVLVKATDAGMQHGMIRAFHNRTYDVTKVVPTVVLRNEDYGRIARLLGDNERVVLEFTIENRVYPEGKTTWNVVAEIPIRGIRPPAPPTTPPAPPS